MINIFSLKYWLLFSVVVGISANVYQFVVVSWGEIVYSSFCWVTNYYTWTGHLICFPKQNAKICFIFWCFSHRCFRIKSLDSVLPDWGQLKFKLLPQLKCSNFLFRILAILKVIFNVWKIVVAIWIKKKSPIWQHCLDCTVSAKKCPFLQMWFSDDE